MASAEMAAAAAEQARQTFAEAVAAALAGTDDDWKAESLSHIADAQSEAGLLPDALTTARKIGNLPLRVESLCKAARIYADHGQAEQSRQPLAEAVAATDGIKRPETRVKALCQIADVQHRADRADRARQTLDEATTVSQCMTDPDAKVAALREIADVWQAWATRRWH